MVSEKLLNTIALLVVLFAVSVATFIVATAGQV